MGSQRPRLPELAKTLYTERHRKLRELLIAKRKAAGLTQTVLAEQLGKPPSYVAKNTSWASAGWTFWNTSILPPRLGLIRVSRLGSCSKSSASGFPPYSLEYAVRSGVLHRGLLP